MIATTNTDDLMKYYDQNDVNVYDLAGPLQYEGNAAVRRDFDNVFANFAGAKGDFVELVVVTTARWGWPAASSTSPGRIRPASRRR